MSVDKRVSEDLMQLLQDSADGFTSAAEKIADAGAPELAMKFDAYAVQRRQFYTELETLAAAYGDDLEESGSVKAAAHRVWMTVQHTLSGSNPSGVLDAASNGEHHAVTAYANALDEDLSDGLRSVVAHQQGEIMTAHAEIKTLASTSS